MYNFNPNWPVVPYHAARVVCALGGYNSFNESVSVAQFMSSTNLRSFPRIGKDAAR